MATDIQFIPDGTVTSARGFTAGAAFAGINRHSKYNLDLGILFSETPCTTVGVFSANKMKAAPVLLCQQRLPTDGIRALVTNSGCANAGTGRQGLEDAAAMMQAAAGRAGVPVEAMLIASTGVIGKRLPLNEIKETINKVELSADGGHSLAKAIMTTDTIPKEAAVKVGGKYTIGGVAKGSGMIHPQLGTLLCFLATDASVDSDCLKTALEEATDVSFNMVSIDGDTSPNDTLLLLANGLAGNNIIKQGSKEADEFQEGLNLLCIHLAKAIAADGEGACRLIEVSVNGAADIADARAAAKTIVGSPLVKTAVHGSDPNWGRILAAAGRSGANFAEDKLDLYIGDVCLIKGGKPLPFDEQKAIGALNNKTVCIKLNLNLGEAAATAWGCDLSEEYVYINSRYTT